MPSAHPHLDQHDLRIVNAHAARLLAEAGAKGIFPTPIDALLSAANIVLLEQKVDEGYVRDLFRKAVDRGVNFLKAIGKTMGLCHPPDRLIIIDETAHKARKPFLKLHETAHAYMPHQSSMFGLMLDCEHNLDPDITVKFESEANAFASEVLFQGNSFTIEAEDFGAKLKTPMDLSKKYGTSIYSAVRRYVSHGTRCCAVVVLEPPELVEGEGLRAALRRIVSSESFDQLFDTGKWPNSYAPSHSIGRLIPSKVMSGSRQLRLEDRNGGHHECVGEAFRTKWNVLVLIHVTKSLTKSTFIMSGA